MLALCHSTGWELSSYTPQICWRKLYAGRPISTSAESQLPSCKAGIELKLAHWVHPGCPGQSCVAQSVLHTRSTPASSGVYLLECNAKFMMAPCVCLKHDAEMRVTFQGQLAEQCSNAAHMTALQCNPLHTSSHYPQNPSSHRSAELTTAGTTGFNKCFMIELTSAYYL